MRLRPEITNIVGVDISANMLAVGRARLENAGCKARLLLADALDVPVADETFDAVTVGFALRNVPDILRLLTSAYRLLKPNGVFGVLEFSRPRALIIRGLYWLSLSAIIPLAGLVFTGNWAAYNHLGKSIIEFPPPDRFIRMLSQAGFKDITSSPMAFGAVTLYIGKK